MSRNRINPDRPLTGAEKSRRFREKRRASEEFNRIAMEAVADIFKEMSRDYRKEFLDKYAPNVLQSNTIPKGEEDESQTR